MVKSPELYRYSGHHAYLQGKSAAIREKIQADPKIRKWFQDLVKLST